jgi:HEAT repeat protein
LISEDPRERVAGAEILGQLGWQDRTFLEGSVDALLGALTDTDTQVLEAAIFALGHRADSRGIEALLSFVDHPSDDIRYAVVHALMPHDTPQVIEALAKLSRDCDRDIRNWATFTLGTLCESRSPALCAALWERVVDVDPATRGEALTGLARRGESSIAPFVVRELEGQFHGDWAVEAAGLLGDPQFLPALKRLYLLLVGDDSTHFQGAVQFAIAACEGMGVNSSRMLQ